MPLWLVLRLVSIHYLTRSLLQEITWRFCAKHGAGKMKYFARSALSLGLYAVFSTSCFASGLVLADNEFRNDLAWLSDRGTLS